MEPNTRDTPMRRTSTLIWGSALMLAVGIVGILLYPLFQPEVKELDDYAQDISQIRAEVKAVHAKQGDTLKSYQFDADKAAEALKAKLNN